MPNYKLNPMSCLTIYDTLNNSSFSVNLTFLRFFFAKCDVNSLFYSEKAPLQLSLKALSAMYTFWRRLIIIMLAKCSLMNGLTLNSFISLCFTFCTSKSPEKNFHKSWVDVFVFMLFYHEKHSRTWAGGIN